MGRFRRKKQFQGARNDDGSRSDLVGGSGGSGPAFTTRDKQKLRKYLQDYRLGAIALAEKTVVATDDELLSSNKFSVAGIEFPTLSVSNLSRPYLVLPSELSFKQRQYVHDCCVHLCLYHCGIERHGSSERFVAISIFCDGFRNVVGLRRPVYTFEFYRCFPPWYSRQNKETREATTKIFREKIQELIDQPGKCIRGALDAINFAELNGEDLSRVEPPRESDPDFILVDTGEKMKQCIAELRGAKEVGFDLEAYNPSQYNQLTCLLQIHSNLGKEYVIDTLARGVWENVGGLAELFGDPDVIKIGHAISGLDACCLHRDFGIFICNVFDTYEAANVLNLPSRGLAAVCAHYGLTQSSEYLGLKETFQNCDWRRRPLSPEMILYARYDVHFLIKLRSLMMRDLTFAELFSDRDAESRLVAESLAATLQRIQDFEDGIEYETPSEAGSNPFEEEPGGQTGSISNDCDVFLTPKNSVSFDEHASVDDDASGTFTPSDEALDEVKSTQFASASVLRLQPRLMRVSSNSQERCLEMWTNRSEPHYRNAVFVALMQPAKQETSGTEGQQSWLGPLSPSQCRLYEDLVRLRASAAEKEASLPGWVCSLDDLARISAGRPTNSEALRVIAYFLPESLREICEVGSKGSNVIPDKSFLGQIFVFTRKSLLMDGVEHSLFDAAARRYHEEPASSSTSSRSGNQGERWSIRMARRMLMVAAVCGGIYLATVAITTSRKRRR